MAIKKLQNNYTTQEQSKRLLELGVPADSADLYYWDGINIYSHHVPIIRRKGDASLMLDIHIPCWSVGRLMEIMDICTSFNPNMVLWDIREHGGSMIENIIYIFDEYTQAFNFSKLED